MPFDCHPARALVSFVRHLPFVIVGSGVFFAVTAAAQGTSDDAMDADRPGLAESSSVVGPGRLQLEIGVQQEHTHSNGSRERTLLVPTLVRIGATERVEIRIESDTYNRQDETPPGGPGQRSEGVAPVSIGAKVRLHKGGDFGVSTAVIGRYFPRSGTGGFQSAHGTGDVRLAADWDFAPRWSLNPNVGIGFYEDDAQRRYASGLLAATLSYKASDTLGLFVDSGVQYPESRANHAGAIVDAGVTSTIGRNLQLDLSAGRRVAGTTFPRSFVALGMSRRF